MFHRRESSAPAMCLSSTSGISRTTCTVRGWSLSSEDLIAVFISVRVGSEDLGCLFRLCMCSAAHFCDCSICERGEDSSNRRRQLRAPFGAGGLHTQQHDFGSPICQNPERYQ